MLNVIKEFVFGGGMKTIENIATEWIQTDTEKAEAKTVLIKALDPNGIMRRQLSRRVSMLYTVYIFTMLLLISVELMCAVMNLEVNTEAIAAATSKSKDLFIPITTLFGTIVTASFGVNAYNVKKNSAEGS